MFGMLGVFEVCIRYRLIPHNANYAAFFEALKTPALVTDRTLRPAWRSGAALQADAGQLQAALAAPTYLTPDLKLSGRRVRGGYAFWTEDETEVHRAQERLSEANELIESENSLIQAETEQREKDAWLQSRHRIYHEIAEILYPCQQRIEGLLGRMEPDTPAFRDQLAQVSVLNAYVKRKTNLLLLASEQDSPDHPAPVPGAEGVRGLSVPGRAAYRSAPSRRRNGPSRRRVIALYDAFEAVAEQLMGKASSLMVSWQGDALVDGLDGAGGGRPEGRAEPPCEARTANAFPPQRGAPVSLHGVHQLGEQYPCRVRRAAGMAPGVRGLPGLGAGAFARPSWPFRWFTPRGRPAATGTATSPRTVSRRRWTCSRWASPLPKRTERWSFATW